MCIERNGLRWLGWLLLVLGGPLSAATLYEQQVETFRPDVETLAEAREKVEKHRDIVIRDDIDARLPHFHRRGPGLKRGETFCQTCHLPLPHTRKVRTRSFLNMHSRYIACGTCHFRPEGVTFRYRWLDLRRGEPVEPDARRFPSRRETVDDWRFVDWIKIAPFFAGEPAVPLPGSDFARDVGRRWRDGDLEARTRLQARLHGPLETKGPECGDCHRVEGPLLDLEALGEDPETARRVYRHSVPQFFQRYREDDQRIRIIDILR